MSTKHELKCWPQYFKPISEGKMTACLRRNDRGYKTEDILILKEWCPVKKEYTEKECYVILTWVIDGKDSVHIQSGYALLSMKLITKQEVLEQEIKKMKEAFLKIQQWKLDYESSDCMEIDYERQISAVQEIAFEFTDV